MVYNVSNQAEHLGICWQTRISIKSKQRLGQEIREKGNC
jgi:hypothetical protein